jgi:putative beta-1,4-xylosyltransferase IRX14
MKLPLLRPLWPGLGPAAAGPPDAAPEPAKPSLPATWLLLHALFCATSMAVGFRFSRLIVYLLFLPTPPINPAAHLVSLVSSPAVALAGANATATITTTTTTTTTVTTTTTTVAADIGGAHPHHHHHRHGPVFVGRHPIRVRAWPHPDPSELLKAHRILAAVQNAQRSTKRRGAGPARPVIAVTPTTTSALQVPSLTSLAHTLRLVDAQLVWIVVEPGNRTDAVAAVLSRSNLDFLHITGPGDSTASLRIHALRSVRKLQLQARDGRDLISRTPPSPPAHHLSLIDNATGRFGRSGWTASWCSPTRTASSAPSCSTRRRR